MKFIIRFLKKLFHIGKRDVSLFRIANEKRNVLVVGVENSVKFGSCPGARRDSTQMRKLLYPISSRLRILQDREATRKNILDALREQVEKTEPDGIFIMTYSGHGGSEAFSDTNKELEPDGKDEFLCCYDTYLKDDEIWAEVAKCRGKVFLVFDCCHSETMYRAPILPPEGLTRDDGLAAANRDGVIQNSPVDMLVWSGCPDNTYSYGDANGGLFTNALLNALSSGKKTYDAVWKHIVADKNLTKYLQKPQKTLLGSFNTGNEIWS